jgi:hypothetical protein
MGTIVAMAMVIFSISKIIGAQVFPQKDRTLEHFEEDKKKEEKAHDTTAGVRRGNSSLISLI